IRGCLGKKTHSDAKALKTYPDLFLTNESKNHEHLQPHQIGTISCQRIRCSCGLAFVCFLECRCTGARPKPASAICQDYSGSFTIVGVYSSTAGADGYRHKCRTGSAVLLCSRRQKRSDSHHHT